MPLRSAASSNVPSGSPGEGGIALREVNRSWFKRRRYLYGRLESLADDVELRHATRGERGSHGLHHRGGTALMARTPCLESPVSVGDETVDGMTAISATPASAPPARTRRIAYFSRGKERSR